MNKIKDKEFTLMQRYIEKQSGIKIGDEKTYLIESRLSKLLNDLKLSNFEELYYTVLGDKSGELQQKTIDAITTNETLWFRDKTPWEVLENKLLPKYIKEIKSGVRSKVRIWSAACSSGQEPYSIAMCIDNYLKSNNVENISLSNFEILATDISGTVLKIAKQGKYDSISITRGLDDKYKEKYFKKYENAWLIDKKIINSVRFAKFNLKDSYTLLGNFDIVFCRYVMIYFSSLLKEQIIKKLYNTIISEGILFIGNSELIIDYKHLFINKRYNNAIFYQKV